MENSKKGNNITKDSPSKTDPSVKKTKNTNGNDLECEEKPPLNDGDEKIKSSNEKDDTQINNETDHNSTKKIEENDRTKTKKNEYYAMVARKNIREMRYSSLDDGNPLFVFPYSKNVVDLDKTVHAYMKYGIHVSENKYDSIKVKSNRQSLQSLDDSFSNKESVLSQSSKKQTKVKPKSLTNGIESLTLLKSYTECQTEEEKPKSKTSKKQSKLSTIKTEDKLSKTQSQEDKSSSCQENGTQNLIMKETTKEEKKENTQKSLKSLKQDTQKNKDLEEKKTETNEGSFIEAEQSTKKEKRKKSLMQKTIKEKKKQEEELKTKDEPSSTPKFITYKVPKYLRNKNITCPFSYKNVFFGKHGIINYDLKGKENDLLVITFHGLNGTNITFSEIQNILIRYRFQVLNFDLYGYGLSACPKYNHREKTYGLDFFVSQTEELLNFLNLQNKNFYLIGFSMGCVIATAFAKKYINQVKKILFISPVGMLEKKPFLLKLLKVCPCVIKCSSYFVSPCFISKKKFRNVDKQVDSSEYLYNRIMWQLFVKKNITHSILGCLNNLKLWSSQELFKEVGLSAIPVLIVCGKKDHICTTSVFQKVVKCFNNSHLIIFENASHLLFVDKQQELIACMLTFFHFPLDNTDMNMYHYMLPIDAQGNYVVKDKRFPPHYRSFNSYLEDINYVPSIFISFLDKEREYELHRNNESSVPQQLLS